MNYDVKTDSPTVSVAENSSSVACCWRRHSTLIVWHRTVIAW